MIALLALVTLVAAAMAQNPAAGTVLMPFSLQGNFSTKLVEAQPPVPGFVACNVRFSGSETGAQWTRYCRASLLANASEEVEVSSVVLPAPSVVACGQNQQIGMTYGVFGGILSGAGVNGSAAACIYYTRVDGQHRSGVQRNAFANFTVFTPTAPVNGTTVTCPAVMPTGVFAVPAVDFSITGFYTCENGVCLDQTMSSYCNSGSLNSVYQIGIGMGIGGVGLLLVTFGLIYVVSKVAQA